MTTKDGAVRFEVAVKPRAHKSAIAGTKGDALLVAVAAPPVDGAANEAVVETLAAALGVPKRSVEILRGETSRTKLVAVHGLDEAELLRRLAVSG